MKKPAKNTTEKPAAKKPTAKKPAAIKPAANKAKPAKPIKKQDSTDIDRADAEGMGQEQGKAPKRGTGRKPKR